jgi:nucleoporin p58/p45
VQRELEFIDGALRQIMSFKDEVEAFMPQHEADVAAVTSDVELMQRKYEAVKAVLDEDVRTVKHLQDGAKEVADDARTSFKAVDNLKLPSHYHTTGLWGAPPRAVPGGAGSNVVGGGGGNASAAAGAAGAGGGGGGGGGGGAAGGGSTQLDATGQDILAYYHRQIGGLERRDAKLRERLAEIQQHMPGVEAGLYERLRSLADSGYVPEGAAQQLIAALGDTRDAIVAQANHVAETRERFVDLQVGLIQGVAAVNGRQ